MRGCSEKALARTNCHQIIRRSAVAWGAGWEDHPLTVRAPGLLLVLGGVYRMAWSAVEVHRRSSHVPAAHTTQAVADFGGGVQWNKASKGCEARDRARAAAARCLCCACLVWDPGSALCAPPRGATPPVVAAVPYAHTGAEKREKGQAATPWQQQKHPACAAARRRAVSPEPCDEAPQAAVAPHAPGSSTGRTPAPRPCRPHRAAAGRWAL